MSDPKTSPKELHAGFKWLFVFIIALIASGIIQSMQGRWPSDISVSAAILFGGAMVPFVAGMILALFFKGWKGVIAGAIGVAIDAGLQISTIHENKEPRVPQSAIPTVEARPTADRA